MIPNCKIFDITNANAQREAVMEIEKKKKIICPFVPPEPFLPVLLSVGGKYRDLILQKRTSHLWGLEPKNSHRWFGPNPLIYLLSNGVLGPQWEMPRVAWNYNELGLLINP